MSRRREHSTVNGLVLCNVRVVISARECSGMKRRGRGIPDYRQRMARSCFVRNPDRGAPGRANAWTFWCCFTSRLQNSGTILGALSPGYAQ